MRERWLNYWSRPAGLREVLWLALPLVISTASTTLQQFIDRMFLVVYSQDAMAAALPAGAVQFALMSLFWGIAMYVNTFVAQYHGAERPRRIGLAVWQGILLGAIATPLLLAAIPLAPWFFGAAGHAPAVRDLEIEYFQILMYGCPAQVIGAAISTFYTGRGLTKVVMRVNILSTIINIVLDYLWIFGHAGFPRWGIAGAGWATVIAYWAALFVYLALFLQPKYRERFGTWPARLYDRDLFRRLVRYGAPQGLQFAVEVGGFTLFLMVLGRIGDLELAASGLALNVNMLAFMPVFGIGIAAETLVGQRLGENLPNLAARSTWSAFILAVIYSLVIGALYFFCGELLLSLHEMQVENQADFLPLRDMTVTLLKFVALYCLWDSANIVFSCAIKGAGDTLFVLKTTLLMSGVPVVAAWVGIETFGLGLYWCWTVLTVWILSLGCVYFVRFLGGRWREMRVIEQAAPPVDIAEEPLEPCVAEA